MGKFAGFEVDGISGRAVAGAGGVAELHHKRRPRGRAGYDTVNLDVGVEAAFHEFHEIPDGVGRLVGPHAELNLTHVGDEDHVLIHPRAEPRKGFGG